MSEGKARELEIEKAARNYCDETGSMYFEYTDASNELIDAFKAGVAFAQNELQKENEALKAKLELALAVFQCYCTDEQCDYCFTKDKIAGLEAGE